MTAKPDLELETRLSRKLLDVLIRAGLVFALALLCYRIFSPFISLMAWALILAVTLYPAQQKLARKIGSRQGLDGSLLGRGSFLGGGCRGRRLRSGCGLGQGRRAGECKGNCEGSGTRHGITPGI